MLSFSLQKVCVCYDFHNKSADVLRFCDKSWFFLDFCFKFWCIPSFYGSHHVLHNFLKPGPHKFCSASNLLWTAWLTSWSSQILFILNSSQLCWRVETSWDSLSITVSFFEANIQIDSFLKYL